MSDALKRTDFRALMVAAIVAVAMAVFAFAGAKAAPHRASAAHDWSATFLSSATRLPDAPTYTALRSAHPELNFPALSRFSGTLRYRVRIARGGSQARFTFTNPYATALRIGHASVGLLAEHDGIRVDSVRDLRYRGARSIVLAPHAVVDSDPMNFALADGADLIISIYLPDATPQLFWPGKPTDPRVIADADRTMDETLSGATYNQRPLLTRVDIVPARRGRVIIALGDSITDGVVGGDGARGWPGVLAARAAALDISVVNAGIFGNRLLRGCSTEQQSALSRLDRDVITVPGATDIVLLEGINDIGMSDTSFLWCGDSPHVTAAEIISAYQQIIARAHARHIRVVGATLLPFEGALEAFGYYTSEKEMIRQSVNAWIRDSGKFDAVVDFDLLMRDPAHPEKLRGEFDVGDHLHPNEAGARAMASYVNLASFR